MTGKAVVLLSGGLDSATALAWATQKQGWECYSIAFDYGQRHHIELQASADIAKAFAVKKHQVIAVDLHAIGGSALTSEMDVPKDQVESQSIPSTYVPARNLIFLSLASAFAETVGANKLVIGANVVDYSGYPDCRPEFLDSFAKTVALGTKAGVEGADFEVVAPLLHLDKSEIIQMGLALGVDYAMTRSCYDPKEDGSPCGHCDSCHFRNQGFAALGKRDPLLGKH
ncbi:7-cyano-7-deazaguanine synthase QueC [Ghiorsea bivora]|uniref:7-cyano-7-deazaguanine synthase QueC n=1 Tax=Ghiorsea bivora TaxID=1485545 RepID=UPI000570A120|nr:7-cyano-7-deazaguanine synthase QueC [Ghiorsea bivora]